MCVVDGLQKVDSSNIKHSQSSLISIDKAYSNAYDDALKDDIQLNEKKKTITQQLILVK